MKKQSYKDIELREYWSIHQWLRRKYGNANKCDNNCGEKRKGYFEYALIHGKKYEKKRENYKMLCKKCHYIYDDLKNVGPKHPMWGKHHTEETRKKMSKQRIGNKYALGNKLSIETRKKMSIAKKGIKFTEEHKRHLKEANKRYRDSLKKLSTVDL